MAKARNTLIVYFLALAAPILLNGQIVQVGSGSYTTRFPGTDEAGRNSFPGGTPYVTGEAATKPVPTNDWWSNLVKESFGGQAFNYPLSYRTYPRGVAINYTMPYGSSPHEYRAPMDGVFDGIIMGVEDLNSTSCAASDFSDWTATIEWNDGTHRFSALMGHGMPFTYFTKDSSDVARVEIGFNEAGAYSEDHRIIIKDNYRDADYIVYGPAGSTWTKSGNSYTSTLNGKNYWSMVMVPAGMDMAEAIPLFEKYAYVFPTGTRIEWEYDKSTSMVSTDYTIAPTVKEGSDSTVFWGILPHHWANLATGSAQPVDISYNTVRGELKALSSNSFSTELRYSGILPTLPDLAKYSDSFDPAELYGMIKLLKSVSLPGWTDSYNQGQEMNLLIQTARVADQIGYIEARDEILATIQERLEDWLTAEAGEVAFLFYYHDAWDALLGYPAGHRQDNNLNDHHFHWGYFIHAAAFIEQYMPGWAEEWSGMIDLLIRDAANPSRTDDLFPFLRNYSPYAGHSWANGFATEPFGNDQESTSESMQFNSALIHWGTMMGDDEIRDLGIFLYTTEHSSVNEYWFDQNERTFQPEYGFEMVARIWGGGYDNGTWWTTDPAASYGIQIYPIHGGSLYLGHDSGYVQEVWEGMKKNTDVLDRVDNDNLWYDTYWKYLSFVDAGQALDLYNKHRDRKIKFGISGAHTYQWLHTMYAVGQVADEITADYPIAAAFEKDGEMTYAAHNYGSDTISVYYSDGYELTVPPRSRATNRDISTMVSLRVNDSLVPAGASVQLTAEVSDDVTKVEFYQDGVLIGTVIDSPFSVSTGSLEVGFPGFFARAYVDTNFNISNVVAIQVGEQLAYSGIPAPIPGTIQAGEYDDFPGGRGQGICYSDNKAWNEGGFRPDEYVDAVDEALEGRTVGWIEGGEWLEYTVNIESAGDYPFSFRYASGVGGGGGPFHLQLDGEKINDDIRVPSTGDWGAWRTKTAGTVSLPEGIHILRVQIDDGGFNLGRMSFGNTVSSAAHDSSIKLAAYPNPVADILTLSLTSDSGLITIRDITGRLVSQLNVSGFTQVIDMRSYPEGVYFFTFTDQHQSHTTRILKK